MKEYFVWLAKFITKIVVIVIAIPVLIGIVIGAIAAIDETTTKKGNPANEAKVAVIPLEGVISESKTVIESLEKSVDDPDVKAIVLRINSPGGAVGPSQEIFMRARELGSAKPIVASMDTVAASGGMYAAAGCNRIYALPGTLTGSIGVIMQIPNVTKASDFVGVRMMTITAGKLKDAGNMFREMTPEERAFFEELAKTTHDQFIADVAAGRKLSIEAVRKFADGRVILGSQAKAYGLIDEVGGLHEAAQGALKLAGITNKEPKLYYPSQNRIEELKKAFSQAKAMVIGSTKIELSYRAIGF